MLLQPTTPDAKESVSFPDWFAKNAIDFIEAHHYVTLVLSSVLVVAAIYGLYKVIQAALQLQSTAVGTKKAVAEGKKVDLENLKLLHEAEERHAQQCEALNKKLLQFTTALRSNKTPDEIDSLREDIISHYCETYLITLGHYLDYYSIFHDRNTCLRFIRSTVIKELRTAWTFSQAVNHKTIISGMGRARLPLSRASFDKIWGFSDKYLRFYNFAITRAIRVELNRWPKDDL